MRDKTYHDLRRSQIGFCSSVSSVRDKTPNGLRHSQKGLCSSVKICERQNSQRLKTFADRLLFICEFCERQNSQIAPSPKELHPTVQTPQSSRNQTVTHTIQDHTYLTSRRASSPCKKGMFSNAEGHILKYRRAYSQIQKGMFSNTEGHILKYRRAYSQIQKGPFFCLNTHVLHSCGAKQIYIKIKYSSPSHAFHSPHPFPFHPHSTLFPSAAHSPLSVTPRTCSSVTLSPLATNLFPCPLLNPSTYNVTLRTCSPVTMSINTTNLFPCPLVNPSSCKLFLSSYFFVGTCLKHCNANSSLFVTHFYRQKHNYQ